MAYNTDITNADFRLSFTIHHFMQPISVDWKRMIAFSVSAATILIAIAAIMAAGTYGRSIEPSAYRAFSVSGQGEAVGIPDIATFSFSIVTEGGEDLAVLQEKNTADANAAIAFLKEQGVDAKDIATSGYNVSPRYQYYNCNNIYRSSVEVTMGVSSAMPVEVCPPAEIVGYTVTQTVSVKSRDFSKTGALLAGVVGKGANTVSSLSFEIDNPDTIESEARAEAIAKARAKAEAVAKAGGFSVGRILSIDEGYAYPMYERAYTMDAEAYGKGAGVATPVIEPGSQEVVVNVTMRFEIR